MASVTYKCPNCSSALIYNPDTGKFVCGHCGSSFTAKKSTTAESANERASAEDEFYKNSYLFQCPNCGAEVIAGFSTVSAFCHYCHNPVVSVGRLSGKYKPDKIIPFTISEEAAKEEFYNWISSKEYISRSFQERFEIKYLRGVYIPFWLAEAECQFFAKGKASRIHVQKENLVYKDETHYFSFIREGIVKIKNIAFQAAFNANENIIESVFPYNFNEIKDFDTIYLQGFMTEKMNREKGAVKNEMENITIAKTTELYKETIDYPKVSIKTSRRKIISAKWELMLLPVWILTCRHKDKLYYFALNGQTGMPSGVLPPSDSAFFKKFIRDSLAAFCLLYFILDSSRIFFPDGFISAMEGIMIVFFSGISLAVSYKKNQALRYEYEILESNTDVNYDKSAKVELSQSEDEFIGTKVPWDFII